jgi:NAD(P)H dehydrogenase (quinone)
MVGAGTYAAGDGSRQPTPLELGVAKQQGKIFAEYVKAHWPTHGN